MKRSPRTRLTSVSKNSRRAGMSKPGMLATARPITMAAMSPVSSRRTSQNAATPMTAASCAVVPRISPSRSPRSSPHSTAVPTTAAGQSGAHAGQEARRAAAGMALPECSRQTAWKTHRSQDGPDRVDERPLPGQDVLEPFGLGRTKLSSGPTTVGPDTTRMTPIMTAAPQDMPRSDAATRPAKTQVMTMPTQISLTTARRMCP